MTRYLPVLSPVRPDPDDRDDALLIALDDEPELQAYAEQYDRICQEPPMYPERSPYAPYGRLWDRGMAERNRR